MPVWKLDRKIKREGYQAHRDGKDCTECPYEPIWDRPAAAWLHGWWKREYGLTNPDRRNWLDDEDRQNLARAAGAAAFEEGQPCVPALYDTMMHDLIVGVKVGEGEPILKAWIEGWTQANLQGWDKRAAARDTALPVEYSRGRSKLFKS